MAGTGGGALRGMWWPYGGQDQVRGGGVVVFNWGSDSVVWYGFGLVPVQQSGGLQQGRHGLL